VFILTHYNTILRQCPELVNTHVIFECNWKEAVELSLRKSLNFVTVFYCLDYICVYVCMYVYYVRAYVYMYVYMCVRMYVM
jgi:hypothetical protein